MAALDEEEARSLFQYISNALEDGTGEEDSDVVSMPELEEPVKDPGLQGSQTISLEGEDADFHRSINFSYELQEGAEEIMPDTIGIEQLSSIAAGLPGGDWEASSTSVGYDEDTGEIEFYTVGTWKLHFLFEGALVQYSFFGDWFVPFDPEELLEELEEE